MADLSKIKLNGTVYNLKDSFSRSELERRKIIVLPETCSFDDDSLDPGDTVTISKTYLELGQLAREEEVVVLLQLKIVLDRGTTTRVFIHKYTGGNTRSGYFYEIINPKHYFKYSGSVSQLYNSAVLTYHEDPEIEVPEEETMANVIAMLQEFGLDTTITLEPGIADTAHADSLVLTQ